MMRLLAIIFIVLGLLTACGQSGKLYLPDDERIETHDDNS